MKSNYERGGCLIPVFYNYEYKSKKAIIKANNPIASVKANIVNMS